MNSFEVSYALRIILFFVLGLNSCIQYVKYTPDPNKDILQWIKNFGYQKSVFFKYELKTEYIKIIEDVRCNIGWAEYVKGIWVYPESSYLFEGIGVNDREWLKKGTKWEESARGEECDIFSQILRILEFDKFEFVNEDDKYFNYTFKPNVPFLSPGRWREMVGFLKVIKKNYLPELIWAGLPDSSVYCRIEIKNFNQKFEIRPPFLKMDEYELNYDTTINESQAIKKIKRRFSLMNIPHKIEKKEGKIIIKFPSYYQIEDIEEMLSSGWVRVYGVTNNKLEASRMVNLQNDPNTPIYITGMIFNSEDVKDCQIGFDELKRPFVQILLKKKIDLPKEVAIELDNDFIAIASLDFPKKLDKIKFYPDMGYLKVNLLKGIIGQSLFNINLKLLSKGSG